MSSEGHYADPDCSIPTPTPAPDALAAARQIVKAWWPEAGGIWPPTPGTAVARDLDKLADSIAAALAAASEREEELTAKLRVGHCVYCGQEQTYPSAEARREAMIDHTVNCPERPEVVLLDHLAAGRERERRLEALLGDRERLGGMVAEAWGNGTRPLVGSSQVRYMDSGKLGHHLAALIRAALDGRAE